MSVCFLSTRNFTGGSLAIHQAVSRLNALGGNATVMYIKSISKVTQVNGKIRSDLTWRQRLSVDKRLKAFKVPTAVSTTMDDHVVVPEIMPEFAWWLTEVGCKNVYIWWLSVDNFPLSDLNSLHVQTVMRRCHHLCQSYYARDFVSRAFGRNSLMLSDFTDVGEASQFANTSERKFDIAYLPVKARGAGDALKVLERKYSIVALENMGRPEIVSTLMNTKVFLDFGWHPGKDRVPREAALCGAIPMVRYEGAAKVPEDVPLPNELLLDSELFFDLPRLEGRVSDVIAQAGKWQDELKGYRSWITGEKQRFDNELKALINVSSEPS